MFQPHKNSDDELDLSGLIHQDTSAEPPPPRDPNTPGRASRTAQRIKNDKPTEKRAANNNPMQTRSAASRRAEREARRRSITGDAEPRPTARKSSSQLEQSRVAELLRNPTREVTEAELKRDYSYVLADLRSMALLSVALVALLVILAQVLPR